MAVPRLERLSPSTARYIIPDTWQHAERSVDELTSIFGRVDLTQEQKDDLAFLNATICDGGYARTHTTKLAQLHKEKQKPGIFKTISPGSRPDQPNCFIFPITGGGWNVVRYGLGCAEAEGYWTQSPNGWTRCRFGIAADLDKAAFHAGCVETDSGYFATAEQLPHFLEALCVESSEVSFGVSIDRLKQRRRIRLSYKPPKGCTDDPPNLWGRNSKGEWIRMIDDPSRLEDSDFSCRIYKRDNVKQADYVYFDGEGIQRESTRQEVLDSLSDRGLNATVHIRRATNRPWTYSQVPFKGEYPGGQRTHAKYAAQLAFDPVEGTMDDCPTFDLILSHCGSPIDQYITDDCRKLGIETGRDYLIEWARCLFQVPEKPLPFLGMVGPQEAGKSALHESLSLCMKRGYAEIDEALRSANGFNASMEGAVLCVIEETKIGKSGIAYDRLKKYITSKELVIRKMFTDGYPVDNFTHWIQSTNNIDALPIFRGDTRITAWRVPAIPLNQQIHRETMTRLLVAESPYFLGAIFAQPAVESSHRLTLPALRTDVFDDAIHDPIGDCLVDLEGQEFSTDELFKKVRLIDSDCVATPAALGKRLRDYGCEPTKRSHWRQTQ